MKKIILLQVLLSICLAELCAQGPYFAKYRAFLGKDADGYYIYEISPKDFPIKGVASDFGPRWVKGNNSYVYDWHGGIDLNNDDGGDDFGDLVLAAEAGSVHVNGPVNSGTKFIIIQGDDGHNFAYQHILNNKKALAKNQDDEINHEGVKLRRIDNDPLYNNWAMIICNSGDCTAIGPKEGTVTFKDEVGDTRTIYVKNRVDRYDPIASLGNTWKDPKGYPPHLHLQIMEFLSGQSLPYRPDAVGINPLSVIEHTEPQYDVRIIKKAASETTVNEGVDVVKPGTEPTTIKVRCRMLNETNGSTYLHGIGNINSVTLKYKYNNGSTYHDLVGAQYISKIDYGGILGPTTQVSYPRKGATEVMHSSSGQGTWGGNNGVTPRAYSDSHGYPWDDFYFNDFYTQIHKNHKPGGKLEFADTEGDAKYKDGNYQLDARLKTVKGNEYVRSFLYVRIDNFKPYSTQVRVRKYLIPNGPSPVGGNPDIYVASTYSADPDPEVVGDGRLITTKEITEGCWTGSGRIEIRTIASEPMKYMTCEIPVLGTGVMTGTSSGDSTLWVFITPASYTLTPGTNYAMNFTGRDFHGNDILNMASYATQINAAQWSARIPARIADDNVNPHWSPDPVGNQVGTEKLHIFRVTDGCDNPPAIAAKGDLSRGERQCTTCYSASSFSISVTPLTGGQGNVDLALVLPLGSSIVVNSAVWTNSKGVIVGNGLSANNLKPDAYCMTITYNDCCKLTKCINVEGCKDLIANLNIPDCLPETPPIEVSIDLADGVVPAAITWSVPGNEARVMIPGFGKHYVAVSDAYGCETRLDFELTAPVVTAGVQVAATEICGESESVVTLTLPAVIDTTAGWSWNVLDVSAGDLLYEENITLTQFTLPDAGEYKVVFYSPGECPYEKAFTVPEVNTHVMLKDYNNLSYCNPSNPSQNSNDGMIEIMVDDPSAIVQTVWIGPDMNPGANEIDFRKENLKQGDYLVIVIFGENCSSSVYVRIGCCDGPGIPQGVGCTPEITPITEPGGLGSIVLSCGSGGEQQLFYKWDGDDGFHPNNTFRYNLPAGTYCVTITDGCMEKVFCYDIVECYLNPVIISGNVTPTCPGYSAGAIGVSAVGGTAPYKYQWSTGSVQPMLELLAKGRYCVTVTDKNFCRAVQCYDIEEKAVTTRDECNIKCNDKTVANYYPLKEVYHPDNCRKKDILCQDNYPVQLDVLAGTYIYVEEYTNTCLLQERCYNDVAVGAAYVVPKDTVPSPDGSCNWVVKCATETLRVIPGTPQPNYRERGVDAANKCVYAFKEYRCSLGDLYRSANTESTLRSNFVCPAPIGYTCIDDNGNSWKITESNQDDYCWQYFYEGSDTIPFHSECQNAGDPLKDCTTIPGWETLHHGGSGYRGAAGSYSTPDYLNTKGDIRIYPNPATGIVLISTSDFGNEIQSVDVLDQNGRRLRSEHIDGSRIIADTYELKIDYPPGLYIIVVMRKNGEIVPVKVIKI